MLKWLIVVTISGILAGDSTRNFHAPCRILLNEISLSHPPFVELAKICPESSAGNTHMGLAGYGVLVVDPITLQLMFYKSLERVKLVPVTSDATRVFPSSKPSSYSGVPGTPIPPQLQPPLVPSPLLPPSTPEKPTPHLTQSSLYPPTGPSLPPPTRASPPLPIKPSSPPPIKPSPPPPVMPSPPPPPKPSPPAKLSLPPPVKPSPPPPAKPSTPPPAKPSPPPPAKPSPPPPAKPSPPPPAKPSLPPPVMPSPPPALKPSPPAKPSPPPPGKPSLPPPGKPSLPPPAMPSPPPPAKPSPPQPRQPSQPAPTRASQPQPAQPSQPQTAQPSSPPATKPSAPPPTISPRSPLPKHAQPSQPTQSQPLPTIKSSTLNYQPNAPSNSKGENLREPLPSSPGKSCSSQTACPSVPKKPRRSKRETQSIQPNVWAVKEVDLGEISLDDSQPYLVVLIYLPTCKRTSLWDRYRVGSTLTDEVQNEVKQYGYDLLLLSGITEYDATNVSKILPDGADLTYVEPATELHSYSFSKCDKSQLPFNPEGFIHSEPTKGKPNFCPVYEEPDPFSFRGSNLKIQSQKLIVNVVTNLRKKLDDESWRKLTPVQAASKILNLSGTTIYRVMGKYESGVPFSEAKKQCRRRPTTELEPKWQALLYKTITGQYQKNLVARVAFVLKEFVQAVRTQQLQDLEKQRRDGIGIVNPQMDSVDPQPAIRHVMEEEEGAIVDMDDERPAPELYHCSARSFTKILDHYGYKYGKIRNRDSQIFRPVNLKWREMYLDAIDKYDADPTWNVVYLDETWIDPHQRANRGIVLKKYENFQQRKDFTFKDDKISRGSRLIILAAGGADGFIHEATEIFAVSVNAKKKRTDANTDCSSSSLPQDYHDNVKGPKFIQWLEKLFKLLEMKKTVFVMDNCPFHKVLGIPKTSDKKEIIRQWLEEKKSEGYDISEDVSASTKLTKMALLGIVGRITTDDSSANTKIPRTQVQQLARQYGHRVLLLPPYNCDLNPIEYVWNDIKSEVKEKNTDQTVAFAMELAKRATNVYTKEQWQAHIGHVMKLRKDYREGDKVFSAMESTLDDDEAIAAELSDADYVSIDEEVTGESEEGCVYEEDE